MRDFVPCLQSASEPKSAPAPAPELKPIKPAPVQPAVRMAWTPLSIPPYWSTRVVDFRLTELGRGKIREPSTAESRHRGGLLVAFMAVCGATPLSAIV